MPVELMWMILAPLSEVPLSGSWPMPGSLVTVPVEIRPTEWRYRRRFGLSRAFLNNNYNVAVG